MAHSPLQGRRPGDCRSPTARTENVDAVAARRKSTLTQRSEGPTRGFKDCRRRVGLRPPQAGPVQLRVAPFGQSSSAGGSALRVPGALAHSGACFASISASVTILDLGASGANQTLDTHAAKYQMGGLRTLADAGLSSATLQPTAALSGLFFFARHRCLLPAGERR